ncbi:MAG: GNAT family protein [Acidimicrobiales bacterium]|jgi:RimJ/RimL family protein N-acetyltransferase
MLPYPEPQLRGSDFVLRPFREGDFEAALEFSRDQATDPWVPPLPADDPVAVVELFEQYRRDDQLLHLVIAEELGDAYLGEVMVMMYDHQMGEYGCGVVQRARGRGIATEALRMFAGWSAKALDIQRLQALVALQNVPALLLAERVGFRREGVLRAYWAHEGGRVDAVILSMLPAEFP